MVRACRLNVMIDPAPRLSGTAARPLSDMRRMSGRPLLDRLKQIRRELDK